VRYHYKIWPQASPHPAFPNERSAWIAILNVRIAHVATHSPPTKQFEAVVDSGSGDTLFHASIGRSIGIKVEKGIAAGMGGIIKSKKTTAYFHDVNLYVGTDIIKIRAGFREDLSVAGILGRRGFFEHFIVTFDPAMA